MPVRATKRGAERTPLHADWDVIVCGASFAGLAVCRELAGIRRARAHARPLRGRRAPDERLRGADRVAARPRARGARCARPSSDLVIHTPTKTFRWTLPWTFSTFDYPELCALLRAQAPDVQFDTAKVDGRTGFTLHTDRGDLTRAADRRRPRVAAGALQRAQADPAARRPGSRAAWRSTPTPPATTSSCGSTPPTCARATRGASPPATSCASASAPSSRATTSRSRPCAWPSDLDVPAVRYQGNWIPHQMRAPVEDGIFFVGDSAGHCLPTTAEGIRTALYFGLACGRELRLVLDGRQTREQALTRYADFCEEHRWAFTWLLRVQRWVGRLNPYPAMTSALAGDGPPVLRRLVLRALPRDRAAGVRHPGPPEALKNAGAPAEHLGVVLRSLPSLLLRPAIAVLDPPAPGAQARRHRARAHRAGAVRDLAVPLPAERPDRLQREGARRHRRDRRPPAGC